MSTWTCLCPREIPEAIPVCGACLMDRPTAPTLTAKCHDCREPTRQVQLSPGEDGIERCASCHVAYLRERARRDPLSIEGHAHVKAKLEACYAAAGIKWTTKRV